MSDDSSRSSVAVSIIDGGNEICRVDHCDKPAELTAVVPCGFPGIPIWYGLHTRHWWAMVRVARRWRLIEADNPAELARAINDPTWPWPRT